MSTRQPADPRDLTGDELSAFLHSGDPDKRRVVDAHFAALVADMDRAILLRLDEPLQVPA